MYRRLYVPKVARRSLLSLLMGSTFLGISIAQIPTADAQAASAGLVIENQATGSFSNPATNETVSIESNTVQVTVAEVAGVTLIPSGIQEAPIDVNDAGPNQGNTTIDAGDQVFFLFTATNVGNDLTQFFIPGSSQITNGIQSGPVEIIGVDVDGANGLTEPLDFSSLPVTIQASGNNTGDATALGLPTGAILPEGTITIRVPVKIDATVNNGDPISVRLGDTGPNNNSAATQNQIFAASTEPNQPTGGLDFYTQDNNPTQVTGEADGDPINGDTTFHRQEASAFLSTTVGISGVSSVSGVVFQDYASNIPSQDLNDALDPDEAGINEITVQLFADTNNDGEFNPDQDLQVGTDISTDSAGAYSFTNLDNGTYFVLVDQNDLDLEGRIYGGVMDDPNSLVNNPRRVVIDNNFVTANFPFQPAGDADRGDAPSTYGDAPHTPGGAIFLGDIAPDQESLLLFQNYALGAEGDADGTVNDEEGVRRGNSSLQGERLSRNTTVELTIPVQGNGVLTGWIDWDNNGDFELSEQIAADISDEDDGAMDNVINLSVSVPVTADLGATYARFRYSSDVSLSPRELATNGEVEDYQIVVVAEPAICGITDETPGFSNINPDPLRISPFVGDLFWFDWSSLSGNLNSGQNRDFAFTLPDGRNVNVNVQVMSEMNRTGVNAIVVNTNRPLATLLNGNITEETDIGGEGARSALRTNRSGAFNDDVTLRFTFDQPLSIFYADGETSGRSNGSAADRDEENVSAITNGDPWVIVDSRNFGSGFTLSTGDAGRRLEFIALADSDDREGQGTPLALSRGATQFDVILDTNSFGLTGVSLGVFLPDVGDAPSSYGVAAHQVNDVDCGPAIDPYLGTQKPDGEDPADVQSDTGDGDNTSGRFSDEDGVLLNGTLLQGQTLSAGASVALDIITNRSGVLNAWFDWNQDGDFEDEGEQVATNVISNGSTIALPITVPSIVQPGDLYARFRYGSEFSLGPTGYTTDGEVEDYRVTIGEQPLVLLVKRITAINGQTINPNDDTNLALYEDGSGSADNNPNWPDGPDTGTDPDLFGAIVGGLVKREDIVEYTIYFLSTGASTAQNVQFCDRVPDNQTFVADAFNNDSSATPSADGLIDSDQGILLFYNGETTSLTNVQGDDIAQFFPPGSGLPPSCNLILTQTEHNGAIVVNLGNIPTATRTSPTPDDSFGFIRFKATVD